MDSRTQKGKMQLNPPYDAAVAAFTTSVQKLAGNDTRLLLAVSGGPDSLAMLLLAHAAMPERISAATVDHQLRPEAADEANFVAGLCEKLNIPHSILRHSAPIIGNLQSEARAVRYALLHNHADAVDCDFIATAHHADDQLETVLMRIARGSGIDGLAAVRARQGRIVRPMLGFTKSDMEEICTRSGITPVRDPSNSDDSFDRVVMRQWLSSTTHPFDPHRAVRTATAFADVSEALEWMTDTMFETHVSPRDGGFVLNATSLPREIQRRLLLRVLDLIQQGYVPRGEAAENALDTLANGDQQMLGNVLCKGGDLWHFRPAPQRQQ
jgi:tRNA(Ile)-lysidine synthase